MASKQPKWAAQRGRVANEAARLFVEQSLPDLRSAKRKALASLRLPANTALPTDDEVEEAIASYRRVFHAPGHADALRDMRTVARSLMVSMSEFSPRLVGSVLSGVADQHSTICLHLFADPPERVDWWFLDRRIRFDTGETRLTFASGNRERLPSYSFTYQGWPVEVVVFSGRLARQRPVSPRNSKPQPSASLADLDSLLMAS